MSCLVSYQRSLLVSAALIVAATVSAQTIPQFQGLSRMTFTTDAEYSFGIAVGDVNGNGAPDVFMVNFGSTGKTSQLYINDGNGNFTDMTSTLMPSNVGYGGSAVMGDVDGDKDVDIILGSRTSGQRLQLFLNDGKGKFTDASKQISPLPTNFFYDMDIGDVDFDGDLDLVCGSSSVTNRLFINDGKGNFKDVTGIQFPTATEGVWGVTLVDVDRDIDLDVVFTSSSSTKLAKIYINNAKGTFTDQTSTRFPSGFGVNGGRKVIGGDFDGDGDNDLYFCNYRNQNKLLLNDGKGKFTDATSTHLPTGTFGDYMCATADVDEDGDLDILTANLASGNSLEQNRFYLNDGKGKFTDATSTRYFAYTDASTVIALADVDQDGDLDAVIGNWIKTNSVAFNQHRQIYAPNQPVINTTYSLEFYGAPGYAKFPQPMVPAVGLMEAKPHLTIPGWGGRLGLQTATMIILPSVVVPAPAGKLVLNFQVPNDTKLRGLKFHVQGLMVQIPNPISFTNMFTDSAK